MIIENDQCNCPPDTYKETMDEFSPCIPVHKAVLHKALLEPNQFMNVVSVMKRLFWIVSFRYMFLQAMFSLSKYHSFNRHFNFAVCLADTYYEEGAMECLPCPLHSCTEGVIGAQSVHQCGKLGKSRNLCSSFSSNFYSLHWSFLYMFSLNSVTKILIILRKDCMCANPLSPVWETET